MVGNSNQESNTSPLLKKILVLLSEIKHSGQGSIFYNHIKQTLENWEAAQDQSVQIYARMVQNLLDAFSSQLPEDSLIHSQLKLIQTCLTPPVSNSELQLLQENVEQIASLIKHSQPIDPGYDFQSPQQVSQQAELVPDYTDQNSAGQQAQFYETGSEMAQMINMFNGEDELPDEEEYQPTLQTRAPSTDELPVDLDEYAELPDMLDDTKPDFDDTARQTDIVQEDTSGTISIQDKSEQDNNDLEFDQQQESLEELQIALERELERDRLRERQRDAQGDASAGDFNSGATSSSETSSGNSSSGNFNPGKAKRILHEETRATGFDELENEQKKKKKEIRDSREKAILHQMDQPLSDSHFPQPTPKEAKKGMEPVADDWAMGYANEREFAEDNGFVDVDFDDLAKYAEKVDSQSKTIEPVEPERGHKKQEFSQSDRYVYEHGLDDIAINQGQRRNPTTLREKIAARLSTVRKKSDNDPNTDNDQQGADKSSTLNISQLRFKDFETGRKEDSGISLSTTPGGDMRARDSRYQDQDFREKRDNTMNGGTDENLSGENNRNSIYRDDELSSIDKHGKQHFMEKKSDDNRIDDQLNVIEQQPERENVRFLEKSDEERDELLATERYRRELDEQRNEMERLQREFVRQMQTIVAESAEFGVHLGLEIDALEHSTQIHNLEDRRKAILTSLKNLNTSHTELARKFDTAQTYLSIIESDNQKLSDELDRVRLLSLTDELTSLPNRRAFMRRLEDEISRVKRYGFPLSLVIIDIDHFKQVNDKYGHSAGDSVLRVYAEKILSIFRHHDMIARYGGEEFAVLLPNTDLDGVVGALDKVQSIVPTVKCELNGFSIPAPTFSAGITEYRPPESSKQLIERADNALYRAKRLGRNRIVVEPKEDEKHELVDTNSH